MEEKAPYGGRREPAVFTPAFDRYNDPGRIVDFGPYYPVARVMENRAALQYIVREGHPGYSASSLGAVRQGVEWTRWINEFNKGRKWVRRRLFEKLDPMLEADIALATVPSHDPFQDAPSIRLLAQPGGQRARGRDRLFGAPHQDQADRFRRPELPPASPANHLGHRRVAGPGQNGSPAG